ncbi:methylene-tetrahydromethanopterin dehydrogenase N-terminal domain-containing protein [Ignisphaera sp. 4213-co]|uniref:Methylene-tetrahydromethanopterin dehydrogenase N-terminal domain-containing protein n=1 Tax=Ignisphaera cupida TaxID=3050454 RepID=A0ABD4Z7S1_9CREN|nr:methylene-tetrahydromethanopterin dehydrogenase N-terminal domain-containing protein [Ignisphaera sp. 4213-co]MDK6029255.1 methylene-tetrahydromethanopterin dehydrogenase N-terminal domain-containing protein [Ignisphaera sp. 4213-co]
MSSQQPKIVFLFLDTDKHVSPFEPLMVADLFPDAHILLYSNVEPADAQRIVQDAMFPRGPKGVRYTKMFVGGYDVEKVEKIVEVIKKTMFPPFEFAVVVDPRGSNTTAAAAVAKMYQICVKHGFGDFKNKNVAILAGTGPVGVAAAVMFGMEGAKVFVTSRSMEKAVAVANRVNKELGAEVVTGVKAHTQDEMCKAIENADLVLATGAAGVRLLNLETLRNCGKRVKVVADVNAVPPTGVEGLDPNDDDKEILPGVYGVGALRIGTLKNKVLAELFKRAVESAKGIFEYKEAWSVAKQLIAK